MHTCHCFIYSDDSKPLNYAIKAWSLLTTMVYTIHVIWWIQVLFQHLNYSEWQSVTYNLPTRRTIVFTLLFRLHIAQFCQNACMSMQAFNGLTNALLAIHKGVSENSRNPTWIVLHTLHLSCSFGSGLANDLFSKWNTWNRTIWKLVDKNQILRLLCDLIDTTGDATTLRTYQGDITI